jgi:hypothetical protein
MAEYAPHVPQGFCIFVPAIICLALPSSHVYAALSKRSLTLPDIGHTELFGSGAHRPRITECHQLAIYNVSLGSNMVVEGREVFVTGRPATNLSLA